MKETLHRNGVSTAVLTAQLWQQVAVLRFGLNISPLLSRPCARLTPRAALEGCAQGAGQSWEEGSVPTRCASDRRQPHPEGQQVGVARTSAPLPPQQEAYNFLVRVMPVLHIPALPTRESPPCQGGAIPRDGVDSPKAKPFTAAQ